MLTKAKRAFITHNKPHSKISEQYRMIRTNIHFASPDQKDQTLLITSPGFGEGKSTTATNLAISMAQNGEKVLLVDADLRRPSLDQAFQMNNQIGLTDILNEKMMLHQAVQSTEIENLTVLTSGMIPIHPTELLGSLQMKQFIKEAREEYDRVLFDSSPVFEVTDARIIANLCDGVLLVLCNGKTDSHKAVEAKRLLEFARAKITGIILNQQD